MELSCFFDDPMDVGNLISGSSTFSNTSLNIWNFTVHILLKPGLENFEHRFASVCGSLNILWHYLSLGLNQRPKNDLFQFAGHCWVFQICWHIDCSTLTASSFRIWNSLAGIPSPPLAKAHLISHSRISGSTWEATPLWLSGSLRAFLYSSSVYSCHLFLISSAARIYC